MSRACCRAHGGVTDEEETCNKNQVHRLEGCSGLTLFSHSSLVRHYIRQKSLQIAGTICTFGVSFAGRVHLLLDGYKAW